MGLTKNFQIGFHLICFVIYFQQGVVLPQKTGATQPVQPVQPVQPQPQVNQQHQVQQQISQQQGVEGGRGAGPQGDQGRNTQTPVMITDETMRSTMTLPPNPYTSEAFQTPTRDSHYYLTSNVSNFTRVCTQCNITMFTIFTRFKLLCTYLNAKYEVYTTSRTRRFLKFTQKICILGSLYCNTVFSAESFGKYKRL